MVVNVNHFLCCDLLNLILQIRNMFIPVQCHTDMWLWYVQVPSVWPVDMLLPHLDLMMHQRRNLPQPGGGTSKINQYYILQNELW